MNGQEPYAIVEGCSDSRVIPERIFHAAMGDLFTIRVAGNVIQSSLEIQKDEEHGLRVIGAIYHIENGTVDFDV